MNEQAWVLLGQRRGNSWRVRLDRPVTGGPASVAVEWAWILEREEQYGDVAGFAHTHPGGMTTPSGRDVRTMHAWVSCLGRPLVCLIAAGGTWAAYLFHSDDAEALPVRIVEHANNIVTVVLEDSTPSGDSG